MTAELLSGLYRLHADDVPGTYAEAARVILMEHPATEARRADEAELEEMTRREAYLEQNAEMLKARKAEQAAERAAEKALKQAERERLKLARQLVKAA